MATTQNGYGYKHGNMSFLGAIGYEVVKEKEPVHETTLTENLLFPEASSYDADLIVQYNESLQKIKELKKLLFLQEHAPQNKKVIELQTLLQDKESRINSLIANLSAEKEKNDTLSISLSSLADLIELQRAVADNSYKSLLEERDNLIAQNLAEQDLIIANFEKHISDKEAEVSVLKEKIEKEKAEAFAAIQLKIQLEQEALHKANQEKEKIRQDFIASLEQKYQEQNDTIQRLQTQNESLQNFYIVKEQALQSTENAWRDYALDLSQEMQVLEKELAAKEENKLLDEIEMKSLAEKLNHVETTYTANLQRVQILEKEFESLAHLYSQLEETYLIEKVLSAYQSNDKQNTEQLAKEVERYRQEALSASQELEIAKTTSEAFLNNLDKYFEVSENAIKEIDKNYTLAIEALANKNTELAQHFETSNELLSKELALAKAALQQAEEFLTKEKDSKYAIENELKALQENYATLVSGYDKAVVEIATLQQKRNDLASSLENEYKIAFANETNDFLQQIDSYKSNILHLEEKLDEALARQNELQSSFNEDKLLLLQEIEAYKLAANHLEKKLQTAQTNYDEVIARLSSNKEMFENERLKLTREIETREVAKKQLQEQLSDFHSQINEGQLVLVQEQQRLSDELVAAKLLVAKLEEQLNDALAVQSTLQERLNEEQGAFNLANSSKSQELESFKAAIHQLEQQLKEAYKKEEELKLVLSDEQSQQLQTIAKLEADLAYALEQKDAINRNSNDNEHAFNIEKADLLQELESYKILSGHLESQLAAATNSFENLQTKLDNEYSSLKADLAYTIDQKEAISKNFADNELAYKTEKAGLLQELESYKILSGHLESQIAAATSSFENLQMKLDSEYSALKADLAYAIEQKEAISKNFADNELVYKTEKAGLLQELESYKILSQELTNRSNEERSLLSSEKIKLLQEIDSYKIVASHLEQKIEELQANIEDEEAKKQDLMLTSGQLEAKLVDSLAEVDHYKLVTTQLQNNLYDTTSKFEDLQTRLSDEQTQKNELLQTTSKFEEQISNFVKQSEAYKLELTSNKENIISIQLKLAEEQKAKAELANSHAALNKEFETKLEGLNQQIQALLAKELETQEDLLSYQDAIDDTRFLYKHRIEDLKKESQALQADLEKANNAIVMQKEKYKSEKGNLEGQLNKLKNDMAELRSAKLELEKQLAEYQSFSSR